MYNREASLKDKLNGFFEYKLNLPKNDYYSELDLRGYLELKSTLSDINNIFTLKVSSSFVEWLYEKIECIKTKDAALSQLLSTKPNTNGYDIEISNPHKVIAEVKCNVANQRR